MYLQFLQLIPPTTASWEFWVPIIANLIGSIIGGLIGGLLAYFVAIKSLTGSFENAQKLQFTSEASEIRGFLLAIKAELHGLERLYNDEFYSGILDEIENGRGCRTTVPIYQNYFTIFESSGTLLGRISNDELRVQIIDTYLKAKGLINVHLLNNEMLKEVEALINAPPRLTEPLRISLLYKAISEYGYQIKATFEQAKYLLDGVVPLIDQEVKTLENSISASKLLDR